MNIWGVVFIGIFLIIGIIKFFVLNVKVFFKFLWVLIKELIIWILLSIVFIIFNFIYFDGRLIVIIVFLVWMLLIVWLNVILEIVVIIILW